MTTNKTVLDWIEEKKALVCPDEVVWIDGSEEQLAALLRTERGKAGRGVKVKNKAFFLGHVVFLLAGKGKTAF